MSTTITLGLPSPVQALVSGVPWNQICDRLFIRYLHVLPILQMKKQKQRKENNFLGLVAAPELEARPAGSGVHSLPCMSCFSDVQPRNATF